MDGCGILYAQPRKEKSLSFKNKSCSLTYTSAKATPALFSWSYPLNREWNYFEIQILRVCHKSEISIGLAGINYSLTSHVGWDSNSIGYHADNGLLYKEKPYGDNFGTTCTEGDYMGCGIDYENSRNGEVQVYFTKNHVKIGDGIEVSIYSGGMFPSVALNFAGEKIRLFLNSALQVDNDADVIMVEKHQIFQRIIYGWARISSGIIIEDMGTTITHDGISCGQTGLSLIQWHRPISRSLFCFQIEILSVLRAVAIGLASQDYPFDQFPGWRIGSIAYHSDDGRCFHATGFGNQYGPTCTVGDIMTLWVIFKPKDEYSQRESASKAKAAESSKALTYESSDSENQLTDSDSEAEDDASSKEEVHVEFLKNNKRLGQVKTIIPKGGYFPTIGLMQGGEKVRVNMQPYSG